ncbi:MAG: arginine--tRNA ligase [Candidatus Omnitrophota bacterium]|nr:arginine--tRNA ligase [Candidatus Omnitrophota bacterium]
MANKISIAVVIQDAIDAAIRNAYPDELGGENLGCILDIPKDPGFGDFSTNIALNLSRKLKQRPQEIAARVIPGINELLRRDDILKEIREIKVEGAGFINFYLREEYFYAQLKNILAKGRDAFTADIGAGRRALIEFVSANPTGPLSVAHARQAAVGESLAGILAFLGYQVQREYYLNDEGNQINILGKSVEFRLKESQGQAGEFPENYYQGEYIYDIAKEAGAKNIKAEALGDFAAEYILEIIKKELADFKVSFDCWYSQKELRKGGKIQEALDFLRQKGDLYEQDGALWFKSTQFGDDKDRVVIKSDGSYTYLAPDIAYHKEKYLRGFQWLINLWGPDHHGYISRLKAAVQAMGYPEDSLSIVIVQLATISRAGKSVEMSTRRGQYITLREVLDEVGPDAARFFFLMRRTSAHLDFDLEVAKKQTNENPVYYVQYAHARICNILKSAARQPGAENELSLLREKEEIALLKKLSQFNGVLIACLKTTDPYFLTVYLQELAESFHKFYDLHRVLSDNDGLTRARLALIAAVRTVIAAGLELLGISRPEKM